jgi:hypothetical protein
MVVKAVVESAPNDHLAAGPDCSVIPSCQRRVRSAGGHPAVRVGAVSAACVEIHDRAAEHAAPNDHLAASPHRRVRVSRRRCIVEARGDPTVRGGIISAAAV